MSKAKLSIDLFIPKPNWGLHHGWDEERNPASAGPFLMPEQNAIFLLRVGCLAIKMLGDLADLVQVIKLYSSWQTHEEPMASSFVETESVDIFPWTMYAYAVLDGIQGKARIQTSCAVLDPFYEETESDAEKMATQLVQIIRTAARRDVQEIENAIEKRSRLLS